jgi:hypothetical protein
MIFSPDYANTFAQSRPPGIALDQFNDRSGRAAPSSVR